MDNSAPMADLLVLNARPEQHSDYNAWLADLGCEIVFATSDSDLHEVSRARSFAVVVAHVDGADALPNLALADFAGVPLVFVSAEFPRDLANASSGLFDFVASPIVPELMRVKVRVFLDLKRAQDNAAKLERERDALVALSGDHVHRGKNLLAIIQSVSLRTVNDGRNISEARAALLGRLRAISRAYQAVTAAGARGIDLGEIVEVELGEASHRAVLSGPIVRLRPGLVQTVTLAMHELVTNALSHGALGVPEGSVSVGWTFFDCGDERYLEVDWSEHGRPNFGSPRKPGFGLSLINSLAGPGASAPNFRFDADGFTCQMRLQQDMIAAE